jgi:hypothetical protein
MLVFLSFLLFLLTTPIPEQQQQGWHTLCAVPNARNQHGREGIPGTVVFILSTPPSFQFPEPHSQVYKVHSHFILSTDHPHSKMTTTATRRAHTLFAVPNTVNHHGRVGVQGTLAFLPFLLYLLTVTDEQDTASGRAREPRESAEAVRKSYE